MSFSTLTRILLTFTHDSTTVNIHFTKTHIAPYLKKHTNTATEITARNSTTLTIIQNEVTSLHKHLKQIAKSLDTIIVINKITEKLLTPHKSTITRLDKHTKQLTNTGTDVEAIVDTLKVNTIQENSGISNYLTQALNSINTTGTKFRETTLNRIVTPTVEIHELADQTLQHRAKYYTSLSVILKQNKA